MSFKGRGFAGAVAAALGAAGIIAIFVYFIAARTSGHTRFNVYREAEASRLYNEVVSLDLDGDYPETPEMVIDVFNKICRLFYGDMIADEDIYVELLGLQRKLLSSSVTDELPFERQYEDFRKGIDEFYKTGAYTTAIVRGVTVYPAGVTDECFIPTTQDTYKFGKIYWEYHLKSEDGKWKIWVWELTDEYSKPLERR